MRKRTEPTMDQLWVMMATLIAFIEANYDDPWAYFHEFDNGDQAALFRKLEAFRRDPANFAAILAASPDAAKSIGRGVVKQ
jgi:hypothetical protein